MLSLGELQRFCVVLGLLTLDYSNRDVESLSFDDLRVYLRETHAVVVAEDLIVFHFDRRIWSKLQNPANANQRGPESPAQ